MEMEFAELIGAFAIGLAGLGFVFLVQREVAFQGFLKNWLDKNCLNWKGLLAIVLLGPISGTSIVLYIIYAVLIAVHYWAYAGIVVAGGLMLLLYAALSSIHKKQNREFAFIRASMCCSVMLIERGFGKKADPYWMKRYREALSDAGCSNYEIANAVKAFG